jgi:ketosteroid isomerase-like protein
MDERGEVLAAARARAEALAAADGAALARLLHPAFRWISHTGEQFDRDDYIVRNTSGRVQWHRQDLGDPEVELFGDVAILRAVVTDKILRGGEVESFCMPVTQIWVRTDGVWLCAGGHAGPRLSPGLPSG